MSGGTPDLFLFSTSEPVVKQALEGGIDGIVVDWENRGKGDRQRGFDTQINHDTLADLERVTGMTNRTVLCRVNHESDMKETLGEVDAAIDAGASEILLPMVRTPRQVELVHAHIRGRAGLGILVETAEAVKCARELGELDVARVYVGLNDLAIARGSRSIFEPMIDGTLDRIRESVQRPFGVAGLTIPSGGKPIPSFLIMSEIIRLDCSFTFLRRSFLADTAGVGLGPAIRGIREAMVKAKAADEALRRERRESLVRTIRVVMESGAAERLPG